MRYRLTRASLDTNILLVLIVIELKSMYRYAQRRDKAEHSHRCPSGSPFLMEIDLSLQQYTLSHPFSGYFSPCDITAHVINRTPFVNPSIADAESKMSVSKRTAHVAPHPMLTLHPDSTCHAKCPNVVAHAASPKYIYKWCHLCCLSTTHAEDPNHVPVRLGVAHTRTSPETPPHTR